MSTISLNASPAYAYRSSSLADVSCKDFDITADAPTLPEFEFKSRPFRKPSLLALCCTILCLLVTYTAWAVWMYYYCHAHIWPLPRGPLNATDGLLHQLGIITKVLTAFLGLASLILPLILFLRTRRPGRERSFLEFNAWILFCVVIAVIPLLIYFVVLCVLQGQAYSTACDAGEEVTAYFVGSQYGLYGNLTTATLYSTADPGTKLGVYTLTSTGYSAASFARIDVGEDTPDYFRVEYVANENDTIVSGVAYTFSDVAPVAKMSGNLSQMFIEPYNTTLRAVGEVMTTPLSFRLVDDALDTSTETAEEVDAARPAVLRALSTNPRSCSTLKLCAKSISNPESRAKTLIAMGWALYKHAEYSFACL